MPCSTYPRKYAEIASEPPAGSHRRYREFFQCDVDVIGSDSLYNEYELIQIINDVFSKLKIRNVIKILAIKWKYYGVPIILLVQI